MAILTSSPLFNLTTLPSLSGSSTSFTATRFELETGDQSLNASRTTMSRYLRPFKSSIVGESVLSVKSSSLSFLCASRFAHNPNRVQVRQELVVSCPAIKKVGISESWKRCQSIKQCRETEGKTDTDGQARSRQTFRHLFRECSLGSSRSR